MSIFEGFKKDIKKAAIGSAVVAASIAPIESTAQETNKDTTSINKTEISMDPEFYRSEYLKYMEHPSYKERLAREMYGDLTLSKEMQENIDKEYDERLKQIKNVPIEMLIDVSYYKNDRSKYTKNILGDDKVITTPTAANHELTHAVEYRFKPNILTKLDENVWGFKPSEEIDKGFSKIKSNFIDDQSQIIKLINERDNALSIEEFKEYDVNHMKFINILIDYINNNRDQIKFDVIYNFGPNNKTISDPQTIKKIVFNELNDLNSKYFTIQKFWKYFSKQDIEKISEKNDSLIYNLNGYETIKESYNNEIKRIEEDLKYFMMNTEIKARLDDLRIRANKEFQYNYSDEFDINKFLELKKDSQYQDLKNELNLSDEQINELMKYTAMDEGNDTYYHKDWDYSNKEGQA